MIIMGGFTMYEPLAEMHLEFLRNPKILYYARSMNDLEIFNILSGSTRGKLAGDPMAWYTMDESKQYCDEMDKIIPFDWNTIEFPKGERILVINDTCFDDVGIENTLWIGQWDILIETADIVVSVDTWYSKTRKHIESKFPGKKFLSFYQPWLFAKLVSNAKCIISGRLHAAMISSLLLVPTVMVAQKKLSDPIGTFKYVSVGLTGHGPLCIVENLKEITQCPENIGT
jgi:hypothetical protein